MQYTELRGQVFWFRRRAPEPFNPQNLLLLDGLNVRVGKNGYVRFSLQTKVRKIAAALARKYAHLIDVEAAKTLTKSNAPSAKKVLSPHKPTREEIESSARSMCAALLAADENTEAESIEAAFEDEDMEGVRLADRHGWASADIPPNTPLGQKKLLQMLLPTVNFYLYQYCGKTIETPTPEFISFANEFRKFIAIIERRKKGEEVPSPDLPLSKVTVSELYKKFVLHNTVNKVWKDPASSDRYDYAPVVKDFIKIVGDKPIFDLAKSDAIKYYEATLPRDDIGLGTKSKNFDRIKAFLGYGEKYFDIKNIRSPLEISGNYKKIHVSYERFSVPELKALFESEAYKTVGFRKASEFWIPLLGLYTGARIDELSSLELKHIEKVNGVLSCFLSHPDAANAGGKNNFAPRWVPVHPEVIKAGFGDYIDQLRKEGHTRLFPCLGFSVRDGYGKRASADFTKYRRSVGVGAMNNSGSSTKVFHSFRSTLITALVEKRVDGNIRRALVGHASGEVFGVNDNRDVHDAIYDQSSSNMKLLLKELSKIRFSIQHIVYVDTPKMIKARIKRKLKDK